MFRRIRQKAEAFKSNGVADTRGPESSTLGARQGASPPPSNAPNTLTPTYSAQPAGRPDTATRSRTASGISRSRPSSIERTLSFWDRHRDAPSPERATSSAQEPVSHRRHSLLPQRLRTGSGKERGQSSSRPSSPISTTSGTTHHSSSATPTWTCSVCWQVNSSASASCTGCENEPLRPRTRNWRCPNCNFQNSPLLMECESCQASKHAGYVRHSGTVSAEPWQCKRCTNKNPPTSLCCDACYQNRETAPGEMTLDTARYRRKRTDDLVLLSARVASPQSGWVTSSHVDDELKQQEEDASLLVRKMCARSRQNYTKFVDPEFPPDDRSLYGDQDRTKTRFEGHGTSGPSWEWLRSSELGIKWTVIGDSIKPADIVQGKLGDCWFLSALSVLADRPHLINRVLLTKEYNPEGVYAVRFFHDGVWKRVVVDDYFPTRKSKLVYGHSVKNELWVAIIEKAYAKLHGCYAAIVCGQTFHALYDLTGAPCETISIEKPDLPESVLWQRLLVFKQSSFLLAAACGRTGATADEMEEVGLVINHAYSIVDITESSGHKLLKLGNPWGRATWKGAWGTTSHLWTSELRDTLGAGARTYGRDGNFWIAFEDFVKHFCVVDVCKEQESWFSLCMRDVFGTPESLLPQKMFELRVMTSTWMFAIMMQNSKRNETPTNEYQDFGMLVQQCPNGVLDEETHRTVAQLWPTMARISHVEFLGIQGSHRYLLLPFSTAPREFPMDYTFAIYSANPISVRPQPCKPIMVYRNLHKAVCSEAQVREMFPQVLVHVVHRNSAIFIVAANHDEAHFIGIEADCSASVNVSSSRKALVCNDILAPRTQQLITILTQTVGTSYYQWECRYTFVKMTPQQRKRLGAPSHSPPVLDGLHTAQLLHLTRPPSPV